MGKGDKEGDRRGGRKGKRCEAFAQIQSLQTAQTTGK
jgi:hypothetical protein